MPAIVAAAVLFALVDTGSGLPTLLRLQSDLRDAKARMAGLEAELREAEARADRLRSDPFAIEEAIREDLGFARPGETVVRLSGPDGPSNRIP